jgi:hypothetical protein
MIIAGRFETEEETRKTMESHLKVEPEESVDGVPATLCGRFGDILSEFRIVGEAVQNMITANLENDAIQAALVDAINICNVMALKMGEALAAQCIAEREAKRDENITSLEDALENRIRRSEE